MGTFSRLGLSLTTKFILLIAVLASLPVQGCSGLVRKIASVTGDSRTETLRSWDRFDESRKNLLVFVHGFNSSRTTAWGSFPSFIKTDNEFRDFNILLYGYPTRICGQTTDIKHVGEGLASYLTSTAQQYDNIIFVGHSMGGLVVLNALLTINKDHPSLIDRLHMKILTFGTPHGGVQETSYLALVCENKQVEEMQVLGQSLFELKDAWQRMFGKGPGGDDQKDPRRVPVFAFYGMTDEFVPKTSACQGFEQYCAQVDGNHITMVKPTDKDHLAYRKLRDVASSFRSALPSTMPVVSGKVRVAVLPFENLTDVKALRDGMAWSLTDSFLNSNNIIAYNERARLNRAVSEKGLNNDVGYGESDVLSIGELLGMDFVIWGAIQKYQKENYRATVRLVEMKGRKVLKPAFEEAGDDVFVIQKKIFNRLISVLDSGISNDRQQRGLDILAATRSLTAYEYYIKGHNSFILTTPEGYEEAIKWYTEAVRVDPQYSLAWAGLASAYVFWGFERSWNNQSYDEFYQKALAAARKAVDLDPSLSETHRALALVYAYSFPPMREQAESEARKALAINPNDYEAYFAIAKARDGDEEYLLKAIVINPDYILAYNWLIVRVYNTPERMDEAIKASEKILALNPEHALTYGNLAALYLSNGMLDNAIESGKQAIKLKPDLQFVHLLLGILYFQKQSYTEARAALSNALRLNEKDLTANFMLARVYEGLGQTPEAIRQWERYLSIGSLPQEDAEFAKQRLKELRVKK
jgi:tetratricopeptide (TPR) repeat protein